MAPHSMVSETEALRHQREAEEWTGTENAANARAPKGSPFAEGDEPSMGCGVGARATRRTLAGICRARPVALELGKE